MSPPSEPRGSIVVRPIASADTHPLRRSVLRAGILDPTVVFDGDDAPGTFHLGAFEGTEIVGIATVLRSPIPGGRDPLARQLRGMAVRPDLQRSGIGAALVRACLERARAEGGAVLWCNARTPAEGFYRGLGFEAFGDPFEIPPLGPHVRMRRALATASAQRGTTSSAC